MLLDKSLPSLPPSVVPQSAFSPDHESPPSDPYDETPTDFPPPKSAGRSGLSRNNSSQPHRDRSTSASGEDRSDNLLLPSTTYGKKRQSQHSDISGLGDDFIPMALDLHPGSGPSPLSSHHSIENQQFELEDTSITPHVPEPSSPPQSRDYFNTKIRPSRKTSQVPEGDSQGKLDSPTNSRENSIPTSPRIAYQEKGRTPSTDVYDTLKKRNETGFKDNAAAIAPFEKSEEPSRAPQQPKGEKEKFKLQEVPKHKKSGLSSKASRSPISPEDTAPAIVTQPPVSAPAMEHHTTVVSSSPTSARSDEISGQSPRTSMESRYYENGIKESPSRIEVSPMSSQPPPRGDSLKKSVGKPPSITRKELVTSKLSSVAGGPDAPKSAPAHIQKVQESPTSVTTNGGKSISRPVESPVSRSSLDVIQPPMRAKERPTFPNASTSDTFVSPRAPPHPPSESYSKSRNESISTIKSDGTANGDHHLSTSTLTQVATGELMDDELSRILNGDDEQRSSFLRRVSNSVRHARSYSDRYSDRGARLTKEPKWPKSPPVNGTPESTNFPQDMSSPTGSSPESKNELSWYKNELRKERKRNAEKNHKIAELETALNGKSAIKQMNNELREKRSTIVVLDTQKEIVVRELEVLTEHIANAKKSPEPLDLQHLNNTVLLEFAEALEKLKQTYTPQIEELLQRKSNLVDEIAQLTILKEQILQEFEQLSLKNAQLAELNNELVHQIQGLYKASASPSAPPDFVRHAPVSHGLGIYTHHMKDKSSASIDGTSREMRPSVGGESGYSGSTLHLDQDPEPASILNPPQVVNIRKGVPPKKFNWRKGGQNVAKGVSKGLKGAFGSDSSNRQQRDGSLTETIPYGAVQSGEQPVTTLAGRGPPSNDGPGWFNNQKQPLRPGIPPRGYSNGAGTGPSPVPLAEPGSVLYGSELESRAEYEDVAIPNIITRCIREVEARGMNHEGIYRKSGGNSQIQQIKDGFEKSPTTFDISDPDLDINAVTSALKQYLRKLPTPLITYHVYDLLLSSTTIPDEGQRIATMAAAVNQLPGRHRETLEYLTFHLERVTQREKVNLMTPLNVAVVFAPTIMRPESVQREMTDTQAKNQAVQFMIENCAAIFLGEE
ncbi:Rho-type gtpase-activating protein [Agyrium rufum]|nr:Rho-type gtpase-activating protein [Agyrium rufum]